MYCIKPLLWPSHGNFTQGIPDVKNFCLASVLLVLDPTSSSTSLGR